MAYDKVFIISGKVGSGKSTQLEKISRELQQSGLDLDGFLCRGDTKHGERIAYTLVNVRDGSEFLFATNKTREGWPSYGRFCFNPEAFTEGEGIIRKGIKRKSNVIIIDEVGPLELEGRGWASILEELMKETEMVQLWTVRESILESVMEQWSIPAERICHLGKDKIEETIKKIIADVRNDEGSQAAQSRRKTNY